MARKNSRGGQKRRDDPFPGINKQLHPRSRGEYIDYDYTSKLSNEEKEMLSKFTDEYYGASLAHKDDWYGRKKDFHRLKKERKACQHRNNARLRDVLIVSRGKSGLTDDKTIQLTDVKVTDVNKVEDTLIALIDLKDSLKSDE